MNKFGHSTSRRAGIGNRRDACAHSARAPSQNSCYSSHGLAQQASPRDPATPRHRAGPCLPPRRNAVWTDQLRTREIRIALLEISGGRRPPSEGARGSCRFSSGSSFKHERRQSRRSGRYERPPCRDCRPTPCRTSPCRPPSGCNRPCSSKR